MLLQGALDKIINQITCISMAYSNAMMGRELLIGIRLLIFSPPIQYHFQPPLHKYMQRN